jgi:hypothetical protein
MEREDAVQKSESQSQSRSSLKTVVIAIELFFALIVLGGIFKEMLVTRQLPHSPWQIVVFLSLVFWMVLVLFPRFFRWTFGSVVHVQISSPELEQRLRMRYKSEVGQLTDLGFEYLFSDGETFSLYRLALLLPALTVFLMWIKGEVLTIQDGAKLHVCYPVFGSKDKTAYAHPFGLGVKFYSAFQDGTLLVSKNFKGDGASRSMIVILDGKFSIRNTWETHRKQIELMEAEGKLVDRQTGFLTFAEIQRRESAA